MKFDAKIIAIIIATALVSSVMTAGIFIYLDYQLTDGENKPPSLSGLPNITFSEDSPQLNVFNLSDYSSDADSDTLTYSILVNSNPNCGVSIDAENFVDIIPLAEWSGVSYVTIEVSDGKLTDTDMFQVNVTIVNDPLFIVDFTPSSYPEIKENESQEFIITVSDVDNNLFTYEWNIWYNGMIISFSHLGGTSDNYVHITNYSSDGTHMVKVNVSDGEYVVEKIWTLTVKNNRAPEIVEYSPLSSTLYEYEEERITFYIVIFDPDKDPLTVEWYANDVLKQIGGNYTYTVATIYEVEIKVIIADGELADEHTWTVYALPAP